MDWSNGYERSSQSFSQTRSASIGVPEVRRWARSLPAGGSVLDLGCGPGLPLTAVLLEERLRTFGIDAAPSFVEEFRRNLPGVPIRCEPVQTSQFFERSFDAVLAWGLIFLLSTTDQRRLLARVASILVPNGRLLFTAPASPAEWQDALTGLQSTSLGAEEYRDLLDAAGISVQNEFDDIGENHYIDARKR